MHSVKSPLPNEEPFRALCEASAGAPLALLHSCGRGPARLFTDAVDALTLVADEWPTAFERLGRFLARYERRSCVGYLGYDLRDAVEALARTAPDDFPVPVLHFAAYERCREWEPAAVPPPPAVPDATSLRAHTTRADYERRVAAVIEHIRAGDIFQANLTQPFTASWGGDPRALFWRLCHASPAPFAAYLETGEGTAVLSSSPEEFLALDDGVVRSRPIKGTRPRAADRARDAALLAELLASDKDRAELAMIVDLMRNDLGKVAQVGSVQVGPFPEHDSFAQVHHLFATVTARIRDDASIVDLLRATFPPGSVTGAPKLRAMAVIEDLELVRRGVYTGAIGRIGPGRALHLCVAIRTLIHRGERLRFNTGGGVTADSDPGLEYEETLHKAAGLRRALGAEVEAP
jgi:para-aminobenzoate synthetase component 1